MLAPATLFIYIAKRTMPTLMAILMARHVEPMHAFVFCGSFLIITRAWTANGHNGAAGVSIGRDLTVALIMCADRAATLI